MNQNIPNGVNPQTVPQQVPQTPVQPQPTANVNAQGYMQNPYVQSTQSMGQNHPQQMPQAAPQVQPATNVSSQGYQQTPYVQQTTTVDPMAAVTNLNKEEAMEEALSHTTQYSPFQAQVAEIKPETKQTNNKKAYIIIGIIVVIIALFIAFLPQISNLFGWQM